MAEASTTKHDQLVSYYVDIWNEADYSKLPDAVAESVIVHDPGAPEDEMHGRDAFEAFLRELRTGFPDFEVTIDDMLASDDVGMTEWTVTGTHEGEFNGIPSTEREIDLRGMDKILVADGKVEEHRIYYNPQELVEQLGLTEE